MLINGDLKRIKREGNKFMDIDCNINEVLFINLVSVKTDCNEIHFSLSLPHILILMKFDEDFNSASN